MRSRKRVALVIGVAVVAAILAARQLGWLVSWELGAYDDFLRTQRPLASSPSVALVWITEADIQELGHPLPDRVVADALRRLVAMQPRAIGLDVYRDRPSGEGWEELRDVVLAHPEIVLVEKLPDAEAPAVAAPAFLTDRRQVGFSDLTVDHDGVARRGLLMLWDENGQPFLSFGLQLALRDLFADGITMQPDAGEPTWVRLGASALPPFGPDTGGYVREDAGGYQFLLDYRRPNGSFPQATFGDLLKGRVDASLVRGRVVVVGTASPSVKDDFQTPSGLLPGKERVRGAEIHAQTIDQLARLAHGESVPIRSPADGWESLWIAVWCVAGAFVGTGTRSPLRLLAFVTSGLLLLLGGAWLAFQRGLWIPVVPPALGGLGALVLVAAWVTQQERADKLKAVNLFGRFVSRRLVDRIWPDRDLFMEGDRPRPQRITVTVMLTDLIGYTTSSEKKEPAEVMEWLGTYMDRMAQLVEEHGGMVNDFLGDGLMASFGVPFPSHTPEEIDRDARSAVDCGLAMGEALEELNREWRQRGQPTARMRVGILTGPAVVGAIGSSERMKYATVGNTVNTASRLESFDKLSFEVEPAQATWRILIGESTHERLGGAYAVTCIGSHVLKGKGEPVTIYRVLGRSRDLPAPESGDEAGPPGT